MMLAGPSLRVVPLTVHIPLAEVPERLTSELIVAKARIVALGLRRDFGIDTPRNALAGLNPHAGANGKLGGRSLMAERQHPVFGWPTISQAVWPEPMRAPGFGWTRSSEEH